MGTKAKTIVRNEKELPVLCMYRQYDGNPSYHGEELARFFEDIKLVNGITYEENESIANGVGCLAGQLVSYFKGEEPGGYYLISIDEDWGADYIYDITVKENHNEDIKNQSDLYKIIVKDLDNITLFSGNLIEFKKFCE